MILIIVKTILLRKQGEKGVSKVVWSFLKIYNKRARKAARSRKSAKFMKINNWMNAYFYFWVAMCLMLLFVYFTLSRSEESYLFIYL